MDERPGCGTYVVFALVSVWTTSVTVLIHLIAWFADQILLIQGTPYPWYAWPLISLGHVLALALPIVPLARFTRIPRLRAIYVTWSIAIGFVALLGLVRLIPARSTQWMATGQAMLGIVAVLGLVWRIRRRHGALARSDGGLLPALTLVPLVVVPWLVAGALGSPLDTVLGVAAGLLFGLFAGLLLDIFLMPALAAHSAGPDWDIALGGFAAATTLAIMAAGFGVNGMQLLLLVSLPPLGYAVVALSLSLRGRAWLPIALLLGGAVAAPLVFVDPAELQLILGLVELPSFALAAAGAASVLAWVVSFGLWAVRGRSPRPRPAVARVGLVGSWLGGLALYLAAGQPGFYGDELFVVLRDQADLAGIASIEGRDERLHTTHTRLTEHAERTQAPLRTTLDRFGIDYTPYYLVNALEVNGGPVVRAYLERRSDVDRVLHNPRLRPLPDDLPVGEGTLPAPTEPQWNITSIGADRVWSELDITGEGIVVGQSDSGVEGQHPALRANYRGRDAGDDYHWLDPWNRTQSPVDIGGHGTHTLGSAVGHDGIGVAPGAEWFGCVNLARNLGNPARYLDCLQFMLAPYPQDGDPFGAGDPARAAHVINNSWGCPPIEGCDPQALAPAVQALRAAGIFVVASAGNSGPACGSVKDPIALYNDVFTVGAVDVSGDVTSFSSRGPVTVDGSERVKPDIVAPGAAVLSALPGGSYGENDGTSMAGPHVAGVVALMWSAQPRLIGDIDRTEQLIVETARPFSGIASGCFSDDAISTVPNNAFGYGLIDAYEAVRAAQAFSE